MCPRSFLCHPVYFPIVSPLFSLVFPFWLSYGAQCRSTGASGLPHYTHVKCIPHVPSYDALSWGEVEKPCPPTFLFPPFSSHLLSSPLRGYHCCHCATPESPLSPPPLFLLFPTPSRYAIIFFVLFCFWHDS